MATQIPPAILQQQANASAPGKLNPTAQDTVADVATTTRRPPSKKKSAASKLYPKQASADNDGT